MKSKQNLIRNTGMQYKLVITNSAQNDILDAANWYEEQKTGLGELLILSIDKCIALIIKNPFSFALIFLQIRRANTKKFPYSLFYRTDESSKEVIVFAVIHNSRSEKIWKKRIIK